MAEIFKSLSNGIKLKIFFNSILKNKHITFKWTTIYYSDQTISSDTVSLPWTKIHAKIQENILWSNCQKVFRYRGFQ